MLSLSRENPQRPSKFCVKMPSFLSQKYLSDGEGVPGGLHVALGALEPTLVTGLGLEGVQLAVGHGGGDELVATALVAVRGAGEDLVHVVRLALVGLGEDVEDGGGGDAAGGEATLGLGLASVRLDAEEVPDLLEERLGGAVVLHPALLSLGDRHRDVGHLVEVVLEAERKE